MALYKGLDNGDVAPIASNALDLTILQEQINALKTKVETLEKYRPVVLWEYAAGVKIDANVTNPATAVTLNGMPDLTEYWNGEYALRLYFGYSSDTATCQSFLLSATKTGIIWLYTVRDITGGKDVFLCTVGLTGLMSTTWTARTYAKTGLLENNTITNNNSWSPVNLYRIEVIKVK